MMYFVVWNYKLYWPRVYGIIKHYVIIWHFVAFLEWNGYDSVSSVRESLARNEAKLLYLDLISILMGLNR